MNFLSSCLHSPKWLYSSPYVAPSGQWFELDDDEVRKVDRREVEKYLLRTAESLDEIIAICKSNGM